MLIIIRIYKLYPNATNGEKLSELYLNFTIISLESQKNRVQKNTIVLAATYFSRTPVQVSSALGGLTSEFGMVSGVTLSQEPPEQWCFLI